MPQRHNSVFAKSMTALGARFNWSIEETSTLVTLSVCSVLTLGIYLSALAPDSNGNGAFWSFRSSVQSAPVPVPVDLPPFQLSGIQMGMTPIEAGSVQPGMLLSGTGKDGQTGRFQLGHGGYTVSFSRPETGKQAYRIHYAETFWSFSGAEIRHRLKKKFGSPVVNRCGMENSNVGWVCELQWRRTDGVIIEAITKTANAAKGLSKTRLEFVALDPLLENRNTRRAEPSKKSRRKLHKNSSFAKRMKAISAGARER